MNRLGWRAAIAALALVALGAAIGIHADRLHVRSGEHARLMEELRRDPLGTMERELALRPEQRVRVSEILDRGQKNIDAVWQDTHTRLRATVDSFTVEIAAVLDSGQAKKFLEVANRLHSSPGFMDHKTKD